MSKLFYPVVLHKEEEGGYSVRVPDISGCNTQGETLEECYDMALDAIGLCVSVLVEEGKAIPKPSDPNALKTEAGESVLLLEFDFEKYCKKNDTRAVRKTLTIPAWLNTMAEQSSINFSQVLQQALKEELHIATE